MRRLVTMVGVLVVGAGVGPGAAQSIGTPAISTTAPGQSGPGLGLQASLFGGYEINAPEESQQSPFLHNTSQLGGNIGLSFATRGSRVDFAASGGSTFRLDRPVDDLHTVWNHAVATTMGVRLTRRLQLQTSGAVTYSPEYQFTAFSSVGPMSSGQMPFLSTPVLPPNSNYSVGAGSVIGYQGGVALAYAPGTRSTLSAGYTGGYIEFGDEDLDLVVHDLSGLYRRNITRNVALRIGYGYRQGGSMGAAVGSSRPVRTHNLDIGADYGRAVSLSQRSSLTFGFGSALVDYGDGQRYRVFGHAALERRFSRGWRAVAGYSRDMRFIQGLTQPLFSDSVNASLGGQLLPRLELIGSANYAIGTVGVASGDYSSLQSGVRLQSGVARNLGLFLEYYHYQYQFDQAVLPGGSPRGLNRQGIHAGVSLAVPLVR